MSKVMVPQELTHRPNKFRRKIKGPKVRKPQVRDTGRADKVLRKFDGEA